MISEGLAREIHADECGHIYDNVADGVQVVCAIAPLKETSHSVVLSADVVTDLECMPALCKGAEL